MKETHLGGRQAVKILTYQEHLRLDFQLRNTVTHTHAPYPPGPIKMYKVAPKCPNVLQEMYR